MTTRKVELTDAGRALLDEARETWPRRPPPAARAFLALLPEFRIGVRDGYCARQ